MKDIAKVLIAEMQGFGEKWNDLVRSIYFCIYPYTDEKPAAPQPPHDPHGVSRGVAIESPWHEVSLISTVNYWQSDPLIHEWRTVAISGQNDNPLHSIWRAYAVKNNLSTHAGIIDVPEFCGAIKERQCGGEHWGNWVRPRLRVRRYEASTAIWSELFFMLGTIGRHIVICLLIRCTGRSCLFRLFFWCSTCADHSDHLHLSVADRAPGFTSLLRRLCLTLSRRMRNPFRLWQSWVGPILGVCDQRFENDIRYRLGELDKKFDTQGYHPGLIWTGDYFFFSNQ